jgi:hypothetical protein
MNNATLVNLCARFGAAHECCAGIQDRTQDKDIAWNQHIDAATQENPCPSPFVVMVYNDIQAVLRALQTLERLSRQKFRDRAPPRLTPVPVTQLSDPIRFNHLRADANLADIIIVSHNGPGDVPETLKKWIDACLTQKRSSDSAIVALLSSNERVDAPDSPRYQFLKNVSWAAGLDFFAPSPAAGEEWNSANQPCTSNS